MSPRRLLVAVVALVPTPRNFHGKLEAYPFPICSLTEQTEIVRILDSRLEIADLLDTEIEAALDRAEALRQSILKQAFSGKLVPQDPADEPASSLLARIRAERAAAPAITRKKRPANRDELTACEVQG